VTKAAGPLLPVETELPTLVSAPVEVLIEKTEIDPAVAFWKLATKANFAAVGEVSLRGVKKSLHPVKESRIRAKLRLQK
jgi:hypothetical protein